MFDPGPGWRRLDPYEETHRPQTGTLTEHDADGNFVAFWVREVPVPPLPTAPYTVIRVTWLSGNEASINELAFFGGDWIDVNGEACTPQQLSTYITGFEVLAEPYARGANLALIERVRRETAKTVLDRIASEPWAREIDLKKWRFDFEVES